MNSLNIGTAYLVGAAIALTALYLAERRYGVRRIIPGVLAALATLVLWVGIDAPARADVTPCASTRNGWTYDHCAGVITPGPDAWTKPGSKSPFVVTLWRRDVKGGPQTRAARISVADLSGFPVTIGTPGEQWCGLQWDVTRGGAWLAGVQTQWACPTPSPTTTTPTSTETSWTSSPTTSPSTTSEASSSTSSAPTPTTGESSLPTETQSAPRPSGPTPSRPTATESAPTTHGGTRTTSRHTTSSASTTPARHVETLPDTGESWQVYAVLAASSAITGGLILVALVRSERDRGGRYRR